MGEPRRWILSRQKRTGYRPCEWISPDDQIQEGQPEEIVNVPVREDRATEADRESIYRAIRASEHPSWKVVHYEKMVQAIADAVFGEPNNV